MVSELIQLENSGRRDSVMPCHIFFYDNKLHFPCMMYMVLQPSGVILWFIRTNKNKVQSVLHVLHKRDSHKLTNPFPWIHSFGVMSTFRFEFVERQHTALAINPKDLCTNRLGLHHWAHILRPLFRHHVHRNQRRSYSNTSHPCSLRSLFFFYIEK